jgi:spore coat polysaccharide biosynthesis protein SpsF (cytidylyltransferase family)
MIAVVQARFTSARLPGKVLRAMAGKPLLGWLIERLRAARRVTRIVVATSTEESDDAIAGYARQEDVDCYRGSLSEVASRLTAAAERANAEAFVRVNGDSPLVAPAVVDDIIALFQCAQPDLATNVQLRTFPKGFSVEAISVASLRRARTMMRPGEQEHVTGVFYRCPEQFRIVNLTSGNDWGAVQLSVDTAEDFWLVERMLANGPDRNASVSELVKLRERCLADVVA